MLKILGIEGIKLLKLGHTAHLQSEDFSQVQKLCLHPNFKFNYNHDETLEMHVYCKCEPLLIIIKMIK